MVKKFNYGQTFSTMVKHFQLQSFMASHRQLLVNHGQMWSTKDNMVKRCQLQSTIVNMVDIYHGHPWLTIINLKQHGQTQSISSNHGKPQSEMINHDQSCGPCLTWSTWTTMVKQDHFSSGRQRKGDEKMRNIPKQRMRRKIENTFI